MHPLKLVRYFSFVSLALLVIAGILLTWLIHNHEVTGLLEQAEERNTQITRLLSQLLHADIVQLLSESEADIPPDLQSRKHQALVQKFATVLKDSPIAKLKIYNLQGKTVFSTDPAQIGEDKSSNPGFLKARQGEVSSELVHRNQFSAFEGVIENVDLLSSYVPVIVDDKVTAVFEEYQDITPLLLQTRKELRVLGLIIAAILVLLYLMLLLVVRRAQTLIHGQEALLEQANRHLDQRVTERTRALQEREQQLQASEERFRSLTAMSSDFYWETDAEHRFTLRTASEREGGNHTSNMPGFIGILRWEVPHCAPDEAGWAAHRAVLDAHLPFRNFEISRYGANGSVIHLSVSGDPMFDATGSFLGYRGTGTDITERKQAEIEQSIAATAFEVQQSMLVTDAETRILRVNQAFIRSTGFTAEELIGNFTRVLQSGQHDRAFYQAMWQSIRAYGFWEGEIWGKRRNGELYPKWLSISTVKNPAGRVTHYVATYIDLSDRKHAEHVVERLAYYDQLTELPNRSLLIDRMRDYLHASAKKDTYGALLMIDLDNFKILNETNGFASGDILLQQVSQRLLQRVRECDTVARVGGDEFIVVLAEVDGSDFSAAAQHAESFARQLLAAIAQPYMLSHGSYRSTASLGITLFKGHAAKIQDLLRHADMALYQSKRAGGNVFNFFSSSMEAAAHQYLQLEAGLRSAIEQEQFELYYQPQVKGAAGSIVGAEALIRWRHPERGLVPPADFIPHLERSGLMAEVGSWVIETACTHLAQWSEQDHMKDLTVAVNVSAQQFQTPDFVQQVMTILEKTGVNPQRLKIELTESIFVGDPEAIIAMMHKLKALGISFSLDDFGTGYSSLAYLSIMPLDQLKIDRSFVAGIEAGGNNISICTAIISLAHSLKLQVVAEGVETNAQHYILGTVHHCDMLQGYLFGKPVPQGDFERLCLKRTIIPR